MRIASGRAAASDEGRAPGRAPSALAELDRAEFWRRSLRAWDLAFGVLIAIIAVSSFGVHVSATRRAVSLGCLALMVIAYVTLARPGVMRGQRWRIDTYLALLVVLTAVQIPSVDLGAVLLFVSFSHIWFFCRGRIAGVLWCAALSVSVVAAWFVDGGFDTSSLGSFAAGISVSFVFAIGLGLWITQIAERSEERAELLDELRAAQDEVAASHHAAGVLAERERMAQEIHDTLAQGFTSVVMLAQATAAELDRDRVPQARERIGQIEQVARDNLAEARALVAAFGPAGLQDATLAEALARLAARFGDETGVVVRIAPGTAEAAGGLTREQQVVLLRAAQEALANVRRHADADTALLALSADATDARLEVTDDGRGIPDGTPEGHGLRGMRERAAAAGGELVVEPAAGGGTHLELRLPRRRDAAGSEVEAG